MVATATKVLFDEVPGKNASWAQIREFAISFECCWFSEMTGDIANNLFQDYRSKGELAFIGIDQEQLRAALFFEQRRYRHLDMIPDGMNMQYIRELTAEIRRHLIEEHFRFRKPALRFSASGFIAQNIHILSDGVFYFIYEYQGVFPGLGDCTIVKADKLANRKFFSFLSETVDGWEKRYEDPYMLDGQQWELKLNIPGLNKKVTGSNLYPENWDDFREQLSAITGKSI